MQSIKATATNSLCLHAELKIPDGGLKLHQRIPPGLPLADQLDSGTRLKAACKRSCTLSSTEALYKPLRESSRGSNLVQTNVSHWQCAMTQTHRGANTELQPLYMVLDEKKTGLGPLQRKYRLEQNFTLIKRKKKAHNQKKIKNKINKKTPDAAAEL